MGYDFDGLVSLLREKGYAVEEIKNIEAILNTGNVDDIRLLLASFNDSLLEFHLARRLNIDIFRQLYGK